MKYWHITYQLEKTTAPLLQQKWKGESIIDWIIKYKGERILVNCTQLSRAEYTALKLKAS